MPSSLAVGFGCAAQSSAPVVHVDLLSPGGLALCASWAREPLCKWVHIRVPASVFPILHGSHAVEPHPDHARYLYFMRQLVKHCDDTETPWSLECRARSSFWHQEWASTLLHVQINLCQFGHAHRCPIVIATSHASAFAHIQGKCNHVHASVHKPAAVKATTLQAFYKAVSGSILGYLGFSPDSCSLSTLHQAQISLGLQPRKFPLALVPEFKYRVVVHLASMPSLLDGKLCHDLCLPHMVIPAGSKLLAGPENGGMGRCPTSASQPASSCQPFSCVPHTSSAPPSSCWQSSSCAPHTRDNERRAPLCGSVFPSPSFSPSHLDKPMAASPGAVATLPLAVHHSSFKPEATNSEAGLPVMPKATSSEAGLPETPPLIMTPKKRTKALEALSPAKSAKKVCGKANGEVAPFRHEAEYEACALLPCASRDDILRIFDLLPGDDVARVKDFSKEKAWSSGAYAKGGCVGLRRNLKDFPYATRLFVAYLRNRMPDARFSCISVFSDLKQGMHRDSHNMDGTRNYITALSEFTNGQLWIECKEGDKSMSTPAGKLKGTLAEVAAKDLEFDAKRYHCVMSWEGRRVVLVGFTPQCGQKLLTTDQDTLLDSGFPLPWAPLSDCCPSPTEYIATSAGAEAVEPLPAVQHSPVGGGPVSGGQTSQARVTFGVYHSEAEFVSQAIKAGHPRDLYGQLPAEMQNCVDSLSIMPDASVIAKRAAWFTKWTCRARELHLEPDPEWVINDPAMANILDQKRLQLLDEIIAGEGYDDISLARDIRDGFDLVGIVPTSGILPGKVAPATLRPDELSANAPRANEALRMSLGSCGDTQLDQELWEKTMKEVEAGWLVGPLEWEQLESSDVVSHRFPLKQGAKVRPIDDYSRSGVNAAVTTLEQPTVDTADVAAAMYSRLANNLLKQGRPAQVLGRSYDLTSAYRQLCVSKRSAKFANIAVFCPQEKRTFVFKQLCLPFGSRASVNGFIRCSRCIQWIALRCLVLPLTSYYDDFLAASSVALAKNTEDSMSMLFKLLGWKYDIEGPKADVFSDSVNALGVVFDLARTHEGVVMVDNTGKRKEDLDKMVEDILKQGLLDHKHALELRGKLSFADAQVTGLAGRYALQQITAHAYHTPFRASLSLECSLALRFLRKRIAEGKPRIIAPTIKECWLLFTDACFHDDGSGGLGGVLVSPCGSLRAWFSLPLLAPDIAPLLPLNSVNAIGELETIAVALAFLLWTEELTSRCVVSYIDNEGAKFSLIRGCSKSPVLARISQWVATLCERHTVLPWFSRVPSSSNIADPPSQASWAQAFECVVVRGWGGLLLFLLGFPFLSLFPLVQGSVVHAMAWNSLPMMLTAGAICFFNLVIYFLRALLRKNEAALQWAGCPRTFSWIYGE